MGVSFADTGLDDDADFAEAHEINVTPFIDVILVLLIIFMVAAPLATVDLPIDLPSSTATPLKKPDKPTYVSIKPDLAVAIGETPVKRVDLVRALDARAHFDGFALTDLQEGDRLVLRRSADTIHFVHPPGYSYFRMLREKLRWSKTVGKRLGD